MAIAVVFSRHHRRPRDRRRETGVRAGTESIRFARRPRVTNVQRAYTHTHTHRKSSFVVYEPRLLLRPITQDEK